MSEEASKASESVEKEFFGEWLRFADRAVRHVEKMNAGEAVFEMVLRNHRVVVTVTEKLERLTPTLRGC